MSLTEPVTIFDARGNPYLFGGGMGQQGSVFHSVPQDTEQRENIPYVDFDINRLLSRFKHRKLLSASRTIAATFSNVDAAAEQKSDYVSSGGWMPIFMGKDKAYGRAATPVLHSALRILDVRGPLFSFAKDMQLGSRALDIDGDFFIVHLRTETGFPQIQILEAHRIGCRQGETTVSAGPYKGLRILNGIIYNSSGREVAYRFLADDPANDQDLSALDVTHVAHAKWFSDGRPVPAIASGLLDWTDLKETRGYEKMAAKVNSALALLESNETGTARPGLGSGAAPAQVPGTTTAPKTEMLMGGTIRYIKSGAGNDLKAHTSNRPGDGWLRYDERIEAGALRGMGWRAEMFDLSKLSGAGVRGFQDNINTAIHARWKVLAGLDHPSPAVITVIRTVAALADRGDIPRHPEWDQWACPPPIDFTVDANKDRQTDRENVRAGFDTSPAVIRKLGYASAEEMMEAQAEYLYLQWKIAEKWSKDGVIISPAQLGTLAKVGESTASGAALTPGAQPGDGLPEEPAAS